MSNSSTWPTDRTLSGTTTLSQSGPGSDGNELVLCIPQSSSITRALTSECLMSYPRYWLVKRGSYPPAENKPIRKSFKKRWLSFITCIRIFSEIQWGTSSWTKKMTLKGFHYYQRQTSRIYLTLAIRLYYFSSPLDSIQYLHWTNECKLTFISVDEILLSRFINWSANFRSLRFNEIAALVTWQEDW